MLCCSACFLCRTITYVHVKIVLNYTNAGLHQRSVPLVLVMCLGEKQNELTGHKVYEIANKQRGVAFILSLIDNAPGH